MSSRRKSIIHEIVLYVSGACILAILGGAVQIYNDTRSSAVRIEKLEAGANAREDQLTKIEDRLIRQGNDITSIKTDLRWLVGFTRTKWPDTSGAGPN